jgi:peptidoglycan hydrolase-like protein with peptidoglycan-binding domain
MILLAAFSLAAYAQGGPRPTDPNVELVKRAQERLHVHGYDVGTVNGVLDVRTQGALAQFQLSRNLPAGGTLDRATLEQLGVDWAEMEVAQAAAAQPASAGDSAAVKP